MTNLYHFFFIVWLVSISSEFDSVIYYADYSFVTLGFLSPDTAWPLGVASFEGAILEADDLFTEETAVIDVRVLGFDNLVGIDVLWEGMGDVPLPGEEPYETELVSESVSEALVGDSGGVKIILEAEYSSWDDKLSVLSRPP